MMMSRAELDMRAKTLSVPDHLTNGLIAYALDHRPTGGHLRYVLENNLVGAVMTGDSQSLVGLHRTVYFIRSYLPVECWGNEEKVNEWLKQRPEKSRDGASEDGGDSREASGSVSRP